MFELFEEAGFIKILERGAEEYKIEFLGISDLEKILHSSKFALILDMAEECEHFQKSLLEDDIAELDLV